MQQIYDPALLKQLIAQYHLQDIFSFDLTNAASLVRYDVNDMLSLMGKHTTHFIILIEGECIAYSITSNDKVHCENYYKGFSFMGLVAVLWDEPAINDIKALTPCTCLTIPAVPYRSIMLEDVKFLRYALRSLAEHIRTNADHFEPLETRLASFILEAEHNGVFHFNLTLCADLVETSYRHLLRMLRTFCEMNLLERTKNPATPL